MTDEKKPRKKPGPKPGKRPQKVEVDAIVVGWDKTPVQPDVVEKLAALGCNDGEISDFVGINSDTLRYNFQPYLVKGRSELKVKLRRAMINNALGGQAAIQIFMAKNFLGMSDNPTDTSDQMPLPWTEDDV